jgi:hypothetical protein
VLLAWENEGVEAVHPGSPRSTFQVWDVSSWSKDLAVNIAGRGVINHAGAAALRVLADRTGLTGGLSRALARRGFVPVHDRGRVLADTAVLIADGGRVMSDLATLRDQAELYGPIASDPTLWRTLHEIGDVQRRRIARARATTRAHVWSLIAQRHGAIPPSRVADHDLGHTIVIRMDASLVIAHSDKQLAAGTYKGSWGHHPLMAWCDNTGESLALLLRPGSAGSNTTADHIQVLDEAITQLPARYRRDLLITVDGAGASHGLVDHITTLNASPWRRVHYSIGWELGGRERVAIDRVPASAWAAVLDSHGQPRDLGEAAVVELTALLRHGPHGDQLATWPADLRLLCRREAPHPGAQLSLFEAADGWRYQLLATNTPTPAPSSSKPATDPTPASKTTSAPANKPVWAISPQVQSTSIGPGASPPPSPPTCCAGCGCCASTAPWPKPNPRPCATGCCTPPPASSAANANAPSASPPPGPGHANSPPASLPRSRCPHPHHVDQRKPDPTKPTTPGPWNPALTRRDSRPNGLNRTLTTTSTNTLKISIRESKATPATRAND